MNYADVITAFSNAVKEVAGLVRDLVAGKEVARLKYRVESAASYIFVDERSGEYKGISDTKQDSLKVHFKKRVFDES